MRNSRPIRYKTATIIMPLRKWEYLIKTLRIWTYPTFMIILVISMISPNTIRLRKHLMCRMIDYLIFHTKRLKAKHTRGTRVWLINRILSWIQNLSVGRIKVVIRVLHFSTKTTKLEFVLLSLKEQKKRWKSNKKATNCFSKMKKQSKPIYLNSLTT